MMESTPDGVNPGEVWFNFFITLLNCRRCTEMANLLNTAKAWTTARNAQVYKYRYSQSLQG